MNCDNPRFGLDNPEFAHASDRVYPLLVHQVKLPGFRRQDIHYEIGYTLCTGFRQDICMLIEHDD